jgi:signal transduction histidine kinase
MIKAVKILFLATIISVFFSCKDDIQVGGISVSKNDHQSDSLVRHWLQQADRYMEEERYDYAQIWLNKIHERIPIKKNTIADFTILSRQAEVYYYSNLHQLGLQEIERALIVAHSMKDSLLLADSYNFIGLFYTNMDSLDKAALSFEQAIRYTRQPPYPSEYPLLSNPHHIYGNRAELFFKKKQFDLALNDYDRSAQLAKEIGVGRGEAVAYYGKGETLHKIGKADSAMHYFTLAQQKAHFSKDVDIELISFSGLGYAAWLKCLKNESRMYLMKGWDLLGENPTMNHYYTLRYLNEAIRVLDLLNDQPQMIRMMQKKSDIETANIGAGNVQIQQILTAGLNNEKRIAGMEITDAQQKQRLSNMSLIFVVLLLFILIISFFVYRYSQNQRHAVSLVRQKLSQDLHDDIGASLSSMQIYATIAGQSLDQKPEKTKEMIQKINNQSAEVMANMNDIVWSMKTTGGGNASFSLRLKSYASSFLSENDIHFTLDLFDEADQFITGISARKNLLLIAKEAMNNIAKHSGASQVRIMLRKEGKNLMMEIEDNGKGIVHLDNIRGNGLNNIHHRAMELNGRSAILSAREGKGTIIQVVCPLKAIR